MSNSPYISLNDAAKLTGRAKSTISKALKSGKMSYVSRDDETGTYEIDPAEALRVFPKKQETSQSDRKETPLKTPENSTLAMEVKMLREQIEQMETMHDRERQGFADRIEDMKLEAERRNSEHMAALAALTDQRPQEKERKSFWSRLVG